MVRPDFFDKIEILFIAAVGGYFGFRGTVEQQSIPEFVTLAFMFGLLCLFLAWEYKIKQDEHTKKTILLYVDASLVFFLFSYGTLVWPFGMPAELAKLTIIGLGVLLAVMAPIILASTLLNKLFFERASKNQVLGLFLLALIIWISCLYQFGTVQIVVLLFLALVAVIHLPIIYYFKAQELVALLAILLLLGFLFSKSLPIPSQVSLLNAVGVLVTASLYQSYMFFSGLESTR